MVENQKKIIIFGEKCASTTYLYSHSLASDIGRSQAPAIDPARAEADERRRVIRTFQREAQCSEHEANYYLLDAEWNAAAALQTLYADREWAANNPQTAAGRRPTSYVVSADGVRMVPNVIGAGGDAPKDEAECDGCV